MKTTLPRFTSKPLSAAFAALALSALVPMAAQAQAGTPAKAQAHTYPTAEVVFFVEACVAEHPGPRFEMISKCSCVLDKIASEVPFDDFDSMSTATKAFSIGGERGGYIRDVEIMTDDIKRFRGIQAAAKKGCFIKVEPPAPR